jgi:hypothetical protein
MTCRKIFFAIGIISLLSACVDVDKTLGIGLVPDSFDVKVAQAEFPVPMSTKKLDSVVTSSTTVGAVGYLKHPVFGLFTAGAVFRMLPYSPGFDYGAGAQADSAILIIYVSSRTRLHDNAVVSQPLSLYRLNRDLAYSTAYYNTSLKEGDYYDMKISEDITYKGTDTIRIRLTKEFADTLLHASTDEMATGAAFLQTFKGFYLKADTSGVNENNSQVSYFNLSAAHITLHYHTDSDTSAFYYSIEQSTPNFNVYTHGSNTTTSAEKVYLEGLAGVKPYINFVSIKDSITNRMRQAGKDISKLVINRAELVVPVDCPTAVDSAVAALNLYPTMLTLAYATDPTYTFLTDTYLDIFGGTLNRSLQQYSFNLTYYVQGLFNEQSQYHTPATDMYLYPLTRTYDYYGSEVKLLEKTQYTCGVLKSSGARLKLTYTILE